MVYARKPRTTTKTYKKRTYARKPSSKSMYSIAKRVLRANTETKSRVTPYLTDTLNHNIPKLIATQLLRTSQGTSSGETFGNRIGVAIQPVGLKLYVQMAQLQPVAGAGLLNGNIWIKFWVLKTHHSNVNTSNDFLRLISSNTMLAPVQRRTHNVVRSFTVNLKNDFNWWNAGSAIDATPGFKTRVLYIPMGKINSYLYENDVTDDGKYYNYCVHAVAFSAHPSVTTSTELATINLNTELFFKDS